MYLWITETQVDLELMSILGLSVHLGPQFGRPTMAQHGHKYDVQYLNFGCLNIVVINMIDINMDYL